MAPNTVVSRNSRRLSAGLLAACLSFAPAVFASRPATAQTGPSPGSTKPKAPKPYQGPLDVIMSSHLWTNVPAMKDFVTASHPDPKTIDYTSLNGKDPERPKPRDPDGVAALQAELEKAGQVNEKRAVPLGGVVKAADATDAPAPTVKRRVRKASAKPAAKAAATAAAE